MSQFPEPVNMLYYYVAKGIKSADGIRVANQLTLRLGDHFKLSG